jgi:hypothetical protein
METQPDMFEAYVFFPDNGLTWHARIMCAGHFEDHDTGAVTRDCAEAWLTAAEAQLRRVGELLPALPRCRLDEDAP